MKPFSLLLGTILAVAVLAVLMLTFGMRPSGPTEQGAALYNVASETTLKGKITGVEDFTCPVSESEIGRHILLQTSSGVVQVHMAPARVMRSQKFSFSPGDQIEVIGSEVKLAGQESLIAREITRGNESFFIRDREGNLMLVQH